MRQTEEFLLLRISSFLFFGRSGNVSFWVFMNTISIEFPSLAFTCAINSAPAPSLTHSFATSHPHIRCPSYISASALPTPMETALSVFALILPLSISALVLAHSCRSCRRCSAWRSLSCSSSDWWVLRCLCSFSYGEESRRHCCRQLRRQLYWSGHLDQW